MLHEVTLRNWHVRMSFFIVASINEDTNWRNHRYVGLSCALAIT